MLKLAGVLASLVVLCGCVGPTDPEVPDPTYGVSVSIDDAAVQSGSVVDLGHTLDVKTTMVTVTNTGSDALTFSSVGLSASDELSLRDPGSDASDPPLSTLDPALLSLAPDASVAFSIVMERIVSNAPEPSAVVTFESALLAAPLTFEVTGITGEPEIGAWYYPYTAPAELTPVVSDEGSGDPPIFYVYTPQLLPLTNTVYERPVVLGNSGDAPLNALYALTPEAPNDSFGGSITISQVPAAIAPGTTEELLLGMLVDEGKSYARAKLVITSDDPDEPSFSFSVNGSVGV